MTNDEALILALECAIGGGSISILRGRDEIGDWIGVSAFRGEDLLLRIDELLTANDLNLEQIERIAVSAGPGSFTGIRIGIATGTGLAAGLGIELCSISALEAIAHDSPVTGAVVVAVPAGRDGVCFQRFDKGPDRVSAAGEPQAISETKFLSIVNDLGEANLVVHELLHAKLASSQAVINFGSNIAESIGRICVGRPATMAPLLFISKAPQ